MTKRLRDSLQDHEQDMKFPSAKPENSLLAFATTNNPRKIAIRKCILTLILTLIL